MSDLCEHKWGIEPEEVETALGTVHSPLCVHCGAVKLVEENRAAERRRADWAARPINMIPSNVPPAGAPRVHPFQVEFFPDS